MSAERVTDLLRRKVEAALGEGAGQVAWARGRLASIDEVVAGALALTDRSG